MCGYGGIGRRSALRMLWRNPWGFKSPYPHHFYTYFVYFLLAQKIIILLAYIYKGMKGLRWLFGVCLGVLAFYSANALDMDDIARAASRASAQKTASTSQSRSPQTATKNSVTSRNTATTRDRTSTSSTDARSTKTVAPRTTTTVSRTGNVVPRTTVLQRTATPAVIQRTAKNNMIKSRQSTTRTKRSNTSAARAARTMARAATSESGALIANYSNCRQIYYECMDEFCATKDTNLRRCACSTRVNEFDTIKKQMARVEDQMSEFNSRLLLVNMDAEDVETINTATEGENAFYETKDKTKSKKTLDDIAKKLNVSFGDSDSAVSLAPISLSLNVDSAFDTVDSYLGSETTTKTGPALYNAAIPVCREIAAEVCNNDELSIAISGYQMLMEQDCNTVFKSYQSQADAARAKVFESGALLDMSRLDAYQTRNADDLLTCKRKMLDMLSDPTVCGTNMQKCLDMTGKYIDPTTGSAFLTTNLTQLDNLITRPTGEQTWTSANSSSAFLTYLKNKKTYLATAMENCQDIADSVWNGFLEDALSQIKLAQIAKLEEIRQACTTLTADCLTNTADTIAGFDARALSIFGVSADRTTNSLCSDVKTACATLVDAGNSTNWESGMTDIATNKTYDTIISSCTQVGRNCIVQACKSISGNFDLCDDIDFSANRHAILERTSCWPEVKQCVAAAGDDAVLRIIDLVGPSYSTDYKYAFYLETYGHQKPTKISDICITECTTGTDAECATCRIAERIWGNCEQEPYADEGGNRILISTSTTPTAQDTLLAWFAVNTGTASISGNNVIANARSCVNTRCSTGIFLPTNQSTAGACMPSNYDENDKTDDGLYCPTSTGIQLTHDTSTACCYLSDESHTNAWGHTPMGNSGPCCEGVVISLGDDNNSPQICLPSNTTPYTQVMQSDNNRYYLVCVGGNLTAGPAIPGFPNGSEIHCDNGQFVLVDQASNMYYHTTQISSAPTENTARMVFYGDPGDNGVAHGTSTMNTISPTDKNFFIHYGN